MLTLLSKTADNKVVQQKNSKNQNLMHILAKNSNGGNFAILKRIYDQFSKRGVNCLEVDAMGNNALHYAMGEARCYDLSQILIQEGIDINAVNNEGYAPINLYLKGVEGASTDLRPTIPSPYSFFDLCVKNGANLNLPYPEPQKLNKDFKSTIMINMVMNNLLEMDVMRRNLHCLMDHGARLDTRDSEGADIVMHAITQNSHELVNFFLNNADVVYDSKPVKQFWADNRDKNGRNALHYLVQPFTFGSFENTKILEMLCKSQINYKQLISKPDKSGLTPIDLARAQ